VYQQGVVINSAFKRICRGNLDQDIEAARA
jgi:hypothetical protein